MRVRFVAAAVLAVVVLGAAWMLRYDTKPGPFTMTIVTDRWTGNVYQCNGGGIDCRRVF